MEIGDLVTYRGRSYVLRGLDPMSVDDRRAHLEAAMTRDLVTEILMQLDAQVVRVAVTELRESTFYAQVTIQQDGSEIEVDSRPSDAIALAVRAEAPIFVADEVIEESAIEFEGEEINDADLEREVSKFRSF